MKFLKILFFAVALGMSFGLGWIAVPERISEAGDAEWTCSMHPEVHRNRPGLCPVCGMELVREETMQSGPRELVLSPEQKKLAKIETATVERRFVTTEIRMVGKVDYDETRVSTISARVPGRLDRLYVDYTGVPIKRGEHLVWLYSGELLASQQELLEAIARLENPDVSELLADSDRRAVGSLRDKLVQWGLTAEQVAEIETRGTAEDHLLITSPSTGIVIDKLVNQGDYVEVGTKIYDIADLDHLWLRLDAYESDLPWIHYGQNVSIVTEALPGETFHGLISFIDPVLDERTRTVTLRVNVDNADGRLKPGMFVRAVVEAQVAQGGRVMDPRLADKWICSMHPEIVKDQGGECDLCTMALVQAETLGYVAHPDQHDAPLVVPATAVLWTGTRSVVYVESTDEEMPTYEGRVVVLGPRAGDQYLVLHGLEEGERVVVNGAFKIDSALQIRAKTSMMSPVSENAELRGADTETLRRDLDPVFARYFELQAALAEDDGTSAGDGFRSVAETLAAISAADLAPTAAQRWQELRDEAQGAASAGSAALEISALRTAFRDLSVTLIQMEEAFGHRGETSYYQVHCPMAFDSMGADWLQLTEQIANPFYGSSMHNCGDVEAVHRGLGEGR
jgi:Cu(I)/Ag(I) efflux system membrane fusion protein